MNKEVIQIIDNKFKEFEKRRNENLEKRIEQFYFDLVEKISETIDKRITTIPLHTTAPETREKLRMLEERNTQQSESIDLIACQVKEMYDIFTASNWALKTLLYLFAGVGTIAGAVLAMRELFRK